MIALRGLLAVVVGLLLLAAQVPHAALHALNDRVLSPEPHAGGHSEGEGHSGHRHGTCPSPHIHLPCCSLHLLAPQPSLLAGHHFNLFPLLLVGASPRPNAAPVAAPQLAVALPHHPPRGPPRSPNLRPA